MRIIAHLDMDAFFAAVEERDKPRLKGRPIAVGSDPEEGRGRGVVSTANYKAREYGIRSATPISIAWKLSQEAKKQGKPEVVFLDVDMKKYAEESLKIMEIIKKYSSVVEEASIDEAYFDLSFSGSYKKAKEICEKIKEEIIKKEKLTASIGIGPNKLIAKIASDMQKPNGLTIIGSDDEKTCAEFVEAFLEPLSIRKIPGIGPKTEALLKRKNISTVGDLKKFSKKELEEALGKWGSELYYKARGIDDAPLVLEWEAKSIGEQETFQKDTKDAEEVVKRLKSLCWQVYKRFKKSGFMNFKTIAIVVRFSDFETKTRAHTLKDLVDSENTLEFEALKLLMPFFDKRENPKNKKIRLIGVRIEKLK